ncbi:MAG: ribonuclease J [Eubacteriales bacterium]|nr:ribonuclease J [Eubacteriales bacterium]
MSTDKNKKSFKRANVKGKVNNFDSNKKKTYKKSNNNTQSKKSNSKKQSAKKPVEIIKKPPVRIAFLGGLNEIGKNLTLFECNDDIIILDCGMAFPDGDMLGVDLVIPDFTYIEQNKDRVKGIVITHAHEDHIGGLPYLLSKVNVPIYGTRLTVGLIENKLREHSLDRVNLHVVENGGHIKLGCFDVELIHVNHSIPDSVGVAIHSPAGTLVHTGDFKIDCTPMSGGMINLSRFAQLGDEGVLALMADSTNAARPGYTATEQTVADSFDTLFRRARHSRIIIATFASNISRVQQIINCAKKFDRKVAFSGRSMVNYMNVAKELGYLEVPDNIIIDIDALKDYPMEKIVLVTTGSQGEPMSALSRMAYSDHRKVSVGAGDFIIISANPIPGNERTVGNVVDELLKRGCEVVHESMYEVHVSGHACQEELKILHSLVKPKYFIPVHGEQKHLRKHMDLALSLGMKKQDIFIGDIGKMVELTDDSMKELAPVPSGKVFVDGLGVGDVGSIVLRDRKHLGQDGLIIIVASLDVYDGHVISGPDIVSRGFVYVRESEDLLEEIKQRALDILEDCAERNIHEWGVIKNKIKDDVAKLILQRTRRSPMILPILMEV